MVLVFKLLLTPLLIGVVSLIERRWGPRVSGWFVGLPLTSGPVALFLALEQGTVFAARAAQGTMLGLVSVAGFCLVYSWLSLRLAWPFCALLGWSVFFLLTLLLEHTAFPLFVAFVIVISCLGLVLLLFPKARYEGVSVKPPRWETGLRMVIAATFVVSLTGAAGLLGPQLSGLLTPFPIFASILAIFTHSFQGAGASRVVLQGVITGCFTFALFFLVLAGLIAHWGIAAAFGLAMLIAFIAHASSLFIMTRTSLTKP